MGRGMNPGMGPAPSTGSTGGYTNDVTYKRTPLVAKIDASKCTACGICANVCPFGAIRMEDIAVVDNNLCTGCGVCVNKCPLDAITMGKAE